MSSPFRRGIFLLASCLVTAAVAAGSIHDRKAWLDAIATTDLDALSQLFLEAQRRGYPSVANEVAKDMLFNQNKLSESMREKASIPEFRAEALAYAANAFSNKVILGSESELRKQARAIAEKHPNLESRMIIAISLFRNKEDLAYLARFAESNDPNQFRPGIVAIRRLCLKEGTQLLERLEADRDKTPSGKKAFIQETRDLELRCPTK